MPTDASIKITIDPSLLNHFAENLQRLGNGETPENAIARLVASVIDGSAYPLTAKWKGDAEIRIGYRLRSFSQPIF